MDTKPEENQAQKKDRLFSVIAVSGVTVALALIVGAILISGVVLYTGKVITRKIDGLGTSGTVAPPVVQISLDDNAPLLGDRNAKVKIIEYADFQCPFCKQFHDEVFPQLKKDYIDTGKAVFYFQNFPFLGDESFAAAQAATCALQQNKFWEYFDALYSNQKSENSGAFVAANLKMFGANLGLNQQVFATCIDSSATKDQVAAETQAAKNYGVQATPTFFINGVKYEGAEEYSLFKQVIDADLQK